MKISICLALLLPFSPTPSPSGTLSPPAPRLGPPGSGPDLAGPPRPAASLPDTSGHGTPLPTLLPPAGALPGWRWTQGLQRPAPLTHTHTWWSVEGRLKDHRSLPSSTQARTHGSRVRYAFFLFFFFWTGESRLCQQQVCFITRFPHLAVPKHQVRPLTCTHLYLTKVTGVQEGFRPSPKAAGASEDTSALRCGLLGPHPTPPDPDLRGNGRRWVSC